MDEVPNTSLTHKEVVMPNTAGSSSKVAIEVTDRQGNKSYHFAECYSHALFQATDCNIIARHIRTLGDEEKRILISHIWDNDPFDEDSESL